MARCPVANCVGMLEEKVPYIHIAILTVFKWHGSHGPIRGIHKAPCNTLPFCPHVMIRPKPM